jgi:endonuclease YncB( thermonuclease family)
MSGCCRREDDMNQAISFALVVGGMLSVLMMAAGWALMRGSKHQEMLASSQLEAYRRYQAMWDEQDEAIRGER